MRPLKAKKTWFIRLSIFLYCCGGMLTFVYALNAFGEGHEYPYYATGITLVVIIALYLMVLAFACLCVRLNCEQLIERHKILFRILEIGIAVGILVSSFLLRLWYVNRYPMEPASDYKTFYEIAQLLNQNTLIEDGPGYCDYISMFPHVFGYSYALSFVMKYFGTSVVACQWFNILLAVFTCFFVWRIIVLIAGKVSGLIGLFLIAFWPSQILYNNFLASEYLFSFLLVFCIWMFLKLVIPYNPEHSSNGLYLFLHVILGIMIAITSAVRPMGLLFLISIALCLIPSKSVLSIKPRNDLSLNARFLEKGWVRTLFIVISYIIANAFISKCVSYSINQPLVSGSASYGYNLLVGLNQNSYGGWNEEDSDYLYQALEMTGNVNEAQAACRDLAIQRLKVDPISLMNLFLHKYEVLWSNDDYAGTSNLIFMEQQGNLTDEIRDFYYDSRVYDNYWYLAAVALSVIAVFGMRKRESNWSYVLVILYLGTVAMHLVVENQNRYHYHAIFLFAILAAKGCHDIYIDAKERRLQDKEKTAWDKQYQQQQKEALERIEEAQEYAKEQMSLGMKSGFDMGKALAEGHIVVSVTKEIETINQEEKPQAVEEQPAEVNVTERQANDEVVEAAVSQEEVPNIEIDDDLERLRMMWERKPEPVALEEEEPISRNRSDDVCQYSERINSSESLSTLKKNSKREMAQRKSVKRKHRGVESFHHLFISSKRDRKHVSKQVNIHGNHTKQNKKSTSCID